MVDCSPVLKALAQVTTKSPTFASAASTPVRPPVNCVGDWTDYGECSQSCGGGTRMRTFKVETAAQNGGKQCEAKNGATQEDACNEEACPSVDCEAEWKDCSECDDNCETTCTYSITTPASGEDKACEAEDGANVTFECEGCGRRR